MSVTKKKTLKRPEDMNPLKLRTSDNIYLRALQDEKSDPYYTRYCNSLIGVAEETANKEHGDKSTGEGWAVVWSACFHREMGKLKKSMNLL